MLPDFLYCENKSALPGAGLILYTKQPFWVAQIIKFKTRHEFEIWVDKHQPFAAGKPYGYNIIIAATGALEAYKLPTTQSEADSLAAIFRQMADFYIEEKIKRNESYFKRYKEE